MEKGELRVDVQKKRETHAKREIKGKKKEKQVSFYAKMSNVKRAYVTPDPIRTLIRKLPSDI